MASDPLHRTRRRAARVAAAFLVTAALAWMGGCGDNPPITRIEGPGGYGDIVGRLVFQGHGTPPFPSARVLAFKPTGGPCASRVSKVQIAGEFTSWDLSLAPLMSKERDCVWADTLDLQAGTYLFKFVTDGAFDTPLDYGGDENVLLVVPGTYPTSLKKGPGSAIKISVKTAGTYKFVLDEAKLEFTIGPPEAEAGALIADYDSLTAEFRFIDAPVGLYEVTVNSPGYLPVKVEDVIVRHNRIWQLGNLSVEVPGGALRGVVAFADHPSLRPDATVKVLSAGTTTVVQSAQTDSAFVFVGLSSGSYDIVVSAEGYLQERRSAVAYIKDEELDVGIITLAPGCESAFHTIQIAGAFTSWDLALAPRMTKLANCVWIDTLTVQPGSYFFKFVTNSAFDSPLDYGGSESETLPLPGTYPVEPVSGQGTALNISVLSGGNYVFRLDESSLEFTATLLGQVPTGGITGTAAFAGLSTGPYPQATVDLYQGAATTPLATVKSDATARTFRFQTLPNGTYKVEISSPCFVKETRTGVTVAGANVDLGSITLAAGTSAFNTIQIVGEFTSWDPPEAPQMVQAPAGVWTATVQVTADMVGAGKYFKFLTDGAFGNDYGGDESVTLSLPGTYAVRSGVTDGNAIHAQFTTAGTYVFTLDERRQHFTVAQQ